MVKRASRKKRETSRDERRGVGEKKSGRSRKRYKMSHFSDMSNKSLEASLQVTHK